MTYDLKAQLAEAFKNDSIKFFNQTNGLIDISHGRDRICTQAAKDFSKSALSFLKEEGLDYKEPHKAHDFDIMAENVTQAFMSAQPNQADQTYVQQNAADYKTLISHAMMVEITVNALTKAINDGYSMGNGIHILHLD